MKILTLDIESAPNLGHVWSLWNVNVGLPQLRESGYILCVAGKWYGDDEVLFTSLYQDGKRKMIETVHSWLDAADAVVTYNGTKFDIPYLNKEMLDLDIAPPSPFKQIDLLKTSRSQFRFPSNKLDYIAQELGLGSKFKHSGHQLWVDCMANIESAWKEMGLYNREDVVLTEKLYSRFLPWIKGHPNVALFEEEATTELQCPRCGGTEDIIKQGYAYTGVSKYQQYQCKDCNAWFRGRENLADREGIAANIS